MIRPSERWSAAWCGVNVLAIAGALSLAKVGTRIGAAAVAGLVLSASVGGAAVLCARALAERARRDCDRLILPDVVYRKPFWIGFAENMSVLSVGGGLVCVAVLCRVPWVGVTVGASAVLLFAVSFGNEVAVPGRDLCFEDEGLLVSFGEGTFRVSWRNVVSADVQGAKPFQTVAVSLRDNWLVVDTVRPDNEIMRARVTGLFSGAERSGNLVLPSWIGGVDATRLAREISGRSRRAC
jgi:hypothetical protein